MYGRYDERYDECSSGWGAQWRVGVVLGADNRVVDIRRGQVTVK